MLAIGNNEKCPFCDQILNDNVKGREIMKHLQENHKAEMLRALFLNG